MMMKLSEVVIALESGKTIAWMIGPDIRCIKLVSIGKVKLCLQWWDKSPERATLENSIDLMINAEYELWRDQ